MKIPLLLILSTLIWPINIHAAYLGSKPKQEQIHVAISRDGYTFHAVNNNQPVIPSANISESGGLRDPHILCCKDNASFYMAATDMISDIC